MCRFKNEDIDRETRSDSCISPKRVDGSKRAIDGIATHGSELFVVREYSSTVDAYRTSDFVESRHVTVPGMKDPVSLVACPHYNCLYISDYRLECIHRVDLSNSSVINWSVDGGPCGLSVTSNHNLLVTLNWSNTIREYTTHGGPSTDQLVTEEFDRSSLCMHWSLASLIYRQL